MPWPFPRGATAAGPERFKIMDFAMWTFIIVAILLVLAIAGYFVRR